MSTTDCVNSTIQYTFFLVMRLTIAIVTSCDSHFVILFFSSLMLENELKKHAQNVAEINYRFVKLIVIFFNFNTKCDYVIPPNLVRIKIACFR